MKNLLSLPLRPYAGRLFVTCDRKAFARQYVRSFGPGEGQDIKPGILGRCVSGAGADGKWVALVYAETAWDMAHELAHAAIAVCDRCDIAIDCGHDEPFCYLLSQMMEDARSLYGPKNRHAKKRK